VLREIYRRTLRWARGRSKRVPLLGLQVGCPQIAARRRRDKRAFAHVGHIPGKICIHPAAAKLGVHQVVALFLHELGHPMAWRAWRRTEQEDADKAVREFLGIRIYYRVPLMVQWIPTGIAARILGTPQRR